MPKKLLPSDWVEGGGTTSFSREEEGGRVTFSDADEFHPAPVSHK